MAKPVLNPLFRGVEWGAVKGFSQPVETESELRALPRDIARFIEHRWLFGSYTYSLGPITMLNLLSTLMLVLGVSLLFLHKDQSIGMSMTFTGGLFGYVAGVLRNQRNQIQELQKRLDEVTTNPQSLG